MTSEVEIGTILGKLDALCSEGYAIALHIKFTTPTYLFQTYKTEWVEYYSKMGWVLQDPTVHWGFENTGTIHWDDLIPNDKQGIFPKAAEFGLKYGFVLALETDGSRSVSSFARNDRNFSDDEIHEISDLLQMLHDRTLEPEQLSDDERSALTRLSVLQTHG